MQHANQHPDIIELSHNRVDTHYLIKIWAK